VERKGKALKGTSFQDLSAVESKASSV
jgi:hypothetical protein